MIYFQHVIYATPDVRSNSHDRGAGKVRVGVRGWVTVNAVARASAMVTVTIKIRDTGMGWRRLAGLVA